MMGNCRDKNAIMLKFNSYHVHAKQFQKFGFQVFHHVFENLQKMLILLAAIVGHIPIIAFETQVSRQVCINQYSSQKLIENLSSFSPLTLLHSWDGWRERRFLTIET
jgi:homoserine kinase